MRISTIERPSIFAAFCAPTSASTLPRHDSVVVPAAERAQLPQAHFMWSQVKQARIRVTAGGSLGTNGFLGSKGIDASAYLVDGASGVPPRGRPV